jgi:hypothetical protein
MIRLVAHPSRGNCREGRPVTARKPTLAQSLAGHMYFVVGDQIIIVDRNHRIIAIISV